jgi:hypothetical protein
MEYLRARSQAWIHDDIGACVLSLVRKTFRHYRAFGLSSTAKVAWQRFFPPPSEPSGPANYGTVYADDARIEADAQYALRIAKGYVSQLPGGIYSLKGKAVLELGPGLNLGTALLLRCWGAGEVAVADRFLVRFQPTYHPRLYRRLSELVRNDEYDADTEPLDKSATAGRHLQHFLTLIETPLERLGETAALCFDLTLSNAVLEHVYHPLLAIRSLANISRHGSLGLHQVDCRDHRDFSRPLEYLLLDEFSFHVLLKDSHSECGTVSVPTSCSRCFMKTTSIKLNSSPTCGLRPNISRNSSLGCVPRAAAPTLTSMQSVYARSAVCSS